MITVWSLWDDYSGEGSAGESVHYFQFHSDRSICDYNTENYVQTYVHKGQLFVFVNGLPVVLSQCYGCQTVICRQGFDTFARLLPLSHTVLNTVMRELAYRHF